MEFWAGKRKYPNNYQLATDRRAFYSFIWQVGILPLKVVEYGEGFVYLALPGRPIDTGLQWARQAIHVAGKGFGDFFISSLTFLFHFIPRTSLSSPLLLLQSHFSLSLGDDAKWPTRVDESLSPKTINQGIFPCQIVWRCMKLDQRYKDLKSVCRSRLLNKEIKKHER